MQLKTRGSVMGLDRIQNLCKLFYNPQDKLKFIHVTGTNGKGSTAAFTANILTRANYNTSLFSSPYVECYREQIKFNNRNIGKKDFSKYILQIKNKMQILEKKGIFPTEFEVLTLVFFLSSLTHKVNICVMEVGMGGLTDSTNVIKHSLVSIITRISLDHVPLLGSTVEEIATIKSGIIKKKSCCVSSKQLSNVKRIIINSCKKNNTKFFLASEVYKIKNAKIRKNLTIIKFKNINIKINMPGKHSIDNLECSLAAIECLIKYHHFYIPSIAFKKGIEMTRLPGRLQCIKMINSFNEVKEIIYDGGHNVTASLAIKNFIEKFYVGKKISVVIAMMKDKDYNNYVKNISKYIYNFYPTMVPDNPRSLSNNEMNDIILKYNKRSVSFSDPKLAFNKAINNKEIDVVFVIGSFFLIEYLKRKYH
ncbi:MAG: hypothetical protein LBT02_03205 [Rickettsiales bacterium]|jgi:dihydrofolate synthase/folylpolyglutamate synthase|nr:hypothetical protein [Rickettsiales bacterium]